MAYRNLTFRSLASDIRTEMYLGEEHIVIPCVALVGNEVVYGLNAEGPEFIPLEELQRSVAWDNRPVLYDHPPDSTASANTPATIASMSFGQTFNSRVEEGKLKLEAWLNERRAQEIGKGDLLDSAKNGEMIELSVGAIITVLNKSGIAPNGKAFRAQWADIVGDHLAIGLSGSQGACNIEMGCGANRVLKTGQVDDEISDTRTNRDDVRTMRANRGVDTMPEIRTATKPKPDNKAALPSLPSLDIKPRSLKQRILSFASQAFRSLAEDEGLSDKELRDKLWDQLYAVEPAFYGIENVYQESSTVTYITSPDKKLHMWRRTFTTGEDGIVSINEDREEVAVTDFYYIYMGENPTAVVAAQAENAKPCGCQTASVEQSVAANEIDNDTDTASPKEDTNMADDKSKTDATSPNAPASPATPAAPASPATPPAGNPATPAQPATTEEPNTNSSTSTSAPAVTTEQLKALLEDHPVVKHYRAQEAKEKSTLVAKLAAKQTVLTKEQLDAKPIEELRTYAEFLSVNVPAPVSSGDFSGRMMADGADDDIEIKPVPNVWEEARKLRAQRKAGAAN